MKFCFATLGCKVNQFETQALAQLAQQRGHVLAEKQADVCIINTCTVTSSGDHKTLRVLHKLQKENPNAIVALCGCFAQTEPEQAAAMDGVHIVCGTSDRAAVLDLCEQAVRDRKGRLHVTDNRRRQAFEQLPARVFCRRHPRPAQGTGRLRQLLYLLHHSVCARPCALSAARRRRAAGAAARRIRRAGNYRDRH